MTVFKFGGASVNSAEAVRNMASIVRAHWGNEPLVVVVSAMGKTTNALERLVPGTTPDPRERQRIYDQLVEYHQGIIDELGLVETGRVPVSHEDTPSGGETGQAPSLHEAAPSGGETGQAPSLHEGVPSGGETGTRPVSTWFALLRERMNQAPTEYNRDYDQVVSLGELISTTIISHYLNQIGVANQWVDVRTLIRTDQTYRDAKVDWTKTQQAINSKLSTLNSQLYITQGFIAGAPDGSTTTLGREGSDYSAAILSHCLSAQRMTIWKDVPGFLNADPKHFPDTVKIDQLPYNEAIELAYYGASVIHPKTVKPLQNKGIELHIRSFKAPSEPGSVIGPYPCIRPQTPLYIVRHDQTLLSILPKDFSFIAEDNLQTIFAALARTGVRVNLMQNSALSFSLCVDRNPILLNQLQELLTPQFRLKWNEGLQLFTIRYYTQQIIDRLVQTRPILLQQRSRHTAQLVVSRV